MLKVNKIYPSYMNELYIGSRCYNVILDKFGYEQKIDELVKTVSDYNIICIKNVKSQKVTDPLEQTDNIKEFNKQLFKINPNCKVIIYITGTIKPVGLGTMKNIEFVTFLSSDDTTNIDDKTCNWLVKSESKFVFRLDDIDKFDNINLIVSGLDIPKKLVYVNINLNDIKEYFNVVSKLFYTGYNVYLEYGSGWGI